MPIKNIHNCHTKLSMKVAKRNYEIYMADIGSIPKGQMFCSRTRKSTYGPCLR